MSLDSVKSDDSKINLQVWDLKEVSLNIISSHLCSGLHLHLDPSRCNVGEGLKNSWNMCSLVAAKRQRMCACINHMYSDSSKKKIDCVLEKHNRGEGLHRGQKKSFKLGRKQEVNRNVCFLHSLAIYHLFEGLELNVNMVGV